MRLINHVYSFVTSVILLGITASPALSKEFSQDDAVHRPIVTWQKTPAPPPASATAATASDYYGRYYLWADNTTNPGAFSDGELELRADGGTLIALNYQAEFSWQLVTENQLELTFDQVVENEFVEYIDGSAVNAQNVLTSIQIERTFTEIDEQQQMHFQVKRIGYTRYLDSSLPNKPYPDSFYSLKSTKPAGLLEPTQFIRSGVTAYIPVNETYTVVYDPSIGFADAEGPRNVQMIRFSTVTGSGGTAILRKANIQQDGTSAPFDVPVIWQINPDRTVTLSQQDGNSYQLAFLAMSPANYPIMQLRYLSAEQDKPSYIARAAFWVEQQPQTLTEQQLLANPVLELVQSFSDVSRFWFEFGQNGTGIQVSTTDSNNDQIISDNEISQDPFRWQLQNNVLEFQRYRYTRSSGKSGPCLPAEFRPSPTGSCISYSIRRYHLASLSSFNNKPSLAIYNEQVLLATTRQAHWPATNITLGTAAIDFRFLQMTPSRPLPIKPLIAGVAISDDVLRECIKQHNPTLPTDLTELYCRGDIRDLSGIEKFTNLTDLTLEGINHLSLAGLDKLKLLTQLRYVDIYNFQVGDTEFAKLSGMQLQSGNFLALSSLDLTDTSLAVLDSMNIQGLFLGGPISTMPLTRLPNNSTLQNLTSLYLYQLRLPNLVTELNRLKDLSLITELGLMDLGLGTLAQVQLPPNVRHLVFNNETITSLNAAQLNPQQLQTLVMNNSMLNSVSFITELPKLRELNLNRSTLTDWSPLTSPLPITQLQAFQNGHVPCATFRQIKTANPAMNLAYDACSSGENQFELQTNGNLTATAVQFANQADSQFGSLQIINGKLQFVPTTGTTGWVEFTITLTLSDGSRQTLYFRTFVSKTATPKAGLPWWVLSAPRSGT